MSKSNSYQGKVKAELIRLKEHLYLQKAKHLKIWMSETMIQTDASKSGWSFSGCHSKGWWSVQEKLKHINVLGLIAVKFVILTFTHGESVKAIHFQIENVTAPTYLVKIGAPATKNFWTKSVKFGIIWYPIRSQLQPNIYLVLWTI